MTSTTRVVHCGTLIDGTGRPSIANATIVIQGDRIVAVGKTEQIELGQYTNPEVIDVSAHTVTPGLIDAHAHICMNGDTNPALSWSASPMILAFRAATNMVQAFHSGVLTMRDAGAPYGISLAAKQATAEGVSIGPRLVVCGAALCMTGGHAHHLSVEADGPDEMRKTAREQIKLGADFIKLMATGGVATAGEALGAPQFTVEEMTAAVEAAHGAGKRVAAHAIGDAGIRRALQAGVDTIEHGVAFDDETLDMMLQRGAFLIPTFSPAYVQATHGTEMGMPAYVVDKAQQAWETHATCVRRAAEAGVPVALGTDVGGPGVWHGNVALELELMLSSGVCATELDCITAATSKGAEALGLSDELGTIECGKIADLLVVGGNPLQDLAVMRNIKLIIHNGQATSIDQFA